MKKFVQWLKRVFHWVRNVPITRHYWWSVAVVAVTVVVVGAFGWTEQAFRLSSMVLQVAGVFTVAWGILKTRAEFGQQSIRSQFKAWVETFPSYRPQVIAAAALTSVQYRPPRHTRTPHMAPLLTRPSRVDWRTLKTSSGKWK